jgi:beta-lactamase regulating signal transducer with metallopeptidase domain
MNSVALPFLVWLGRATLHASLLVCVLLAVQRLLADRIGVRGRYCLWLVLLLRMAMPWAPQSHLSVYNLLPHFPTGRNETTAFSRTGAPSASLSQTDKAPDAGIVVDTSATLSNARLTPHEADRPLRRTALALSVCWLIGACLLAAYIIASHTRLRRIVRNGRPVADLAILDLFEDCKKLTGVRTAVDLIATGRPGSPALFGFLRVRLLLPDETLAEADVTELRHIFLHELAHLKRHDIAIGHIASLLHVLHWFNPLVALGFRQMQADRELACDALALSWLDPKEAPAYGHTVVQQIERLLTSQHHPMLIGLCGIRARTKKRIALIARFHKGSYRWSPLAVVLLGALACTGLTDRLAVGRSQEADLEQPVANWDEYARRDFPTTQRDRHRNIQRGCIRNTHTNKYLVVDGERVTCDAEEPGLAGLWEFRFDEISNSPESVMYFYSVATRKYLTADEEGNLAVSADEPVAAARWASWPQPVRGVWIVSYEYEGGYLFVDDTGQVRPGRHPTNPRSYWDVHSVWRIKTSDDPASNPQWQREKIPGPD